VGIFFVIILAVFPGAWITFCLPLEVLSWRARLSLGVALSPAVLGLQLVAMKLFSIEFGWAAPILLAANLFSIFFIIKQLPAPQVPRLSKSLVLGAVMYLLLVGTLVVPWLVIPGYRLFSWHALMHTDIVYQLTHSTYLPEEPVLAGLNLSYAWIGHSFWAVVGWVADWPPTYIYPWSNLLWLLVTFVLAYELARIGLRLHQSFALLSVGLMFLGTHFIGSSIRIIAGDGLLWRGWLGFRFAPLLEKYRGFETMPFAFALLVGLTLVCLVALQRRMRFLWAVAACLQIALGLIYPILLPVGCILVGGLVVLLIGQVVKGVSHYSRREIALLMFGQVLALAISAGYLMLITLEHTGSTFQLAQSGRKAKTLHIVVSLFPFLLASLPFLLTSFRQRAAGPILLLITGVCSAALYLMISLGENEYKFIMAATIPLAPLSAAGLAGALHQSSRAKWVLSLALPLFLITIMWLSFFRLDVHVPRSLANAPDVNENSFWLALNPTEEDAAWTEAIRNFTPKDTVLIAQTSHLYLGPFVGRSLLLPATLDGEMSSGYTLPNRLYLLQQRGYPEAVYEQRYEITQIIFTESNSERLLSALMALQDFNRPLAIHFSDKSTPALKWLERQEIGMMLFTDENNVVWFIDHTDLLTKHERQPSP
jgi:hypothetical protein